MNYLIKIIFVVITLGYSIKLYGQQQTIKDYKLLVTLENAPFDTLYLHDYTNDRNVRIIGKKKIKFTWKITIPDSVVNNSENMKLINKNV